MTNPEEIESIQVISPDVIYQQDKAQIDTQIATAKQYPRNIQRARKNCVDIVSIDQATAQTCTYSVPRGGKAITGPSVHLARIIAQQWGNLRIESKVVDIDATHVTSEAVCFDLETNYAVKTQVKKLILDKYGKRFKEDMITVTGNAANSIAFRNAVFNIVPRPVTDSVYNAAIQTLTGDVSDETKLKKRAREVVDRLMGTYNVTEQEVLSAIGKASIDFIDKDDIAVLIGIGTSIKDGDTTVDQAFRRSKTGDVQNPDSEMELDTRIRGMINKCKTLADVDKMLESFGDDVKEKYAAEITAKREEIVKE